MADYQLTKPGVADTPRARAAKKAILPSRQARANARQRVEPGDTQREIPANPHADAVYAAICAFATGMGIRHVEHAMGRLFLVPGEEGRGILLTADADLREVTFKVGGGLVIRDERGRGKPAS